MRRTIRLVDVEKVQHWDSRGHFFAAAAEAMRRILVENARRKNQLRQGGKFSRRPLEDIPIDSEIPPDELLSLDEAIRKFEMKDPEKAKLVKLRFFAGLDHEKVGKVLGISAVTARRHWRYARAWLHREMYTREEPLSSS